jgi:hypothetical protein
MGEMKIKTEVAGRVSALPLAVGAAVRAGDEDGDPGVESGVGKN